MRGNKPRHDVTAGNMPQYDVTRLQYFILHNNYNDTTVVLLLYNYPSYIRIETKVKVWNLKVYWLLATAGYWVLGTLLLYQAFLVLKIRIHHHHGDDVSIINIGRPFSDFFFFFSGCKQKKTERSSYHSCCCSSASSVCVASCHKRTNILYNHSVVRCERWTYWTPAERINKF